MEINENNFRQFRNIEKSESGISILFFRTYCQEFIDLNSLQKLEKKAGIKKIYLKEYNSSEIVNYNKKRKQYNSF